MELPELLATIQNGLTVKAPELALWTISIAAYCMLIYHFYKFIAKRDIFGFNALEVELERRDSFRHISGTLAGAIKYGILFPIIVSIWFSGFSILLFFLAKALSTAQILLISISFVTAIRLVSYYNGDLAKDVAKLIPFVLLGVMIVEPTFFSLDLVQQRIDSIFEFLPDIPVYFAFLVLVEWVLRVLLALKHTLFGVSPNHHEEES